MQKVDYFNKLKFPINTFGSRMVLYGEIVNPYATIKPAAYGRFLRNCSLNRLTLTDTLKNELYITGNNVNK